MMNKVLPRLLTHYHPVSVINKSNSVSRGVLCRFYRGDSPDGQAKFLNEEEEAKLAIKAEERAKAIQSRHHELQTPVEYLNKVDEFRRKRLIYRAKQRGWLEVDLLLGTYADLFVPNMSLQELDEFEDLVNQETIDIYNLLTLRIEVEEGPSLASKMQQWVKTHPLGKADQESYKKAKSSHNLI